MDKHHRIIADPHHVLNGYFFKTVFIFVHLNLVEHLAYSLKMPVLLSVYLSVYAYFERLCLHREQKFVYINIINNSFGNCNYYQKAIPLQPWTGFEDSRRLRLPLFMTVATWRWWGCQPYTPTAFTPQQIFLVLTSDRGWLDPRIIVRPERICRWKIPVTS